MFRFTDWVRGGEVVRDVQQKFPQAKALFERNGIRPACFDCTIEQAARRAGISLDDLLLELNELISSKTPAEV